MISAILQLSVFLGLLTLLSLSLGKYIVWAMSDPSSKAGVRSVIDRLTEKVIGASLQKEMSWKRYAVSMLLFNLLGIGFVYLLQRLQFQLPFNPNALGNVSSDLAFNTAVSFATNTNWQAYGGESTMSHLTQMLGLTSQNFLSAATGIALLAAMVRGFSRKEIRTLGNFWRDLSRCTMLILLPLSLIFALFLVSRGVVQSNLGSVTVKLLEPSSDSNGKLLQEQIIPLGPVASQVAIKQLGTNGGGYFNVNSAHPFENPDPWSNLVQVLAILLIPAALCFSFGEWVKQRQQGWALYAVMLVIFIPLTLIACWAELRANPAFPAQVNAVDNYEQAGGNMEGKEVRFGAVSSAIWAAATTAASNGSVNSMHDSYTPLGGLVPMLFMQLSEVVFGGVGSGLYGLLAYVLVTVFIAGLMVGRTPEYLGKKIEPFEIKMISLVILIPPLLVLVGTACALVSPLISQSVTNPGPHGFSQVLYAYSSMGNNNGSAFAGFGANYPLHTLLGGVLMFISRYWIAIPMLALAASLGAKKIVPPSLGTLPTHSPLFVFFVVLVILSVGALTFFPALALGPIVEELKF